MPALTPSFLFDFESDMQAITEREYSRLDARLWWQRFTKVRPSQSKRERIAWLLSTAMIQTQGKGGNMSFDDLVSLSTEYVNKNSGTGLRLVRDQLEDIDGSGLDLGAQWSADIASYMRYWPQKQIAKAILNGEVGIGYDGQPFFSGAHPTNGFDTSNGTFHNLFTGGVSGNFPGACPIDASVTTDVALANLGKLFAYIASIKMPNGEDPRFLVPRVIAGPPAMSPRLQQLTNAKFIAQAAASGGGGADVEQLIRNWGLQEPVQIDEFGAGQTYTLDDGVTTVTGSDTTFYLGCEQMTSSQLGAFVYVDREPFKITYYTGNGGGGSMEAQLDRMREFEWHCQGRNVAGYGHPFLFFKCKAA